jgi:hypothetical protein
MNFLHVLKFDLQHIPLNSHHPNKKVRYSTPSIAWLPLFRKNQDIKGKPLCGA